MSKIFLKGFGYVDTSKLGFKGFKSTDSITDKFLYGGSAACITIAESNGTSTKLLLLNKNPYDRNKSSGPNYVQLHNHYGR